MYKLVTHGFVASAGHLFYASDYGRNNTIGARSEVGVGWPTKHLSPATISNAVANNLFIAAGRPDGDRAGLRRLFGLPGDSISVGVGGYLNGWEGAVGARKCGRLASATWQLFLMVSPTMCIWAALDTRCSPPSARASPDGVLSWRRLERPISGPISAINDVNASNRSAAQLQADCANRVRPLEDGRWRCSPHLAFHAGRLRQMRPIPRQRRMSPTIAASTSMRGLRAGGHCEPRWLRRGGRSSAGRRPEPLGKRVHDGRPAPNQAGGCGGENGASCEHSLVGVNQMRMQLVDCVQGI